jgi:NAD(P)-dependent dehydrogenase (short-subunit alcohol dehydrogenase family)
LNGSADGSTFQDDCLAIRCAQGIVDRRVTWAWFGSGEIVRRPRLGLGCHGARRFRIEHLDITNHDEIAELHRSLSGELFDVIFIVAGVHDDTTKPIHAVPASEVARLFITNAYSPIYVAEALFDLLKPQGTLAIMSSRMGSVSLAASYTPGEWETYRASKAALNMLARCFYQRHQDEGRTVLIVHPGWVKTDMGGADAPVGIIASAEGLYSTLEKWRGSGKEAYVDFEGNVLPW